jgi:hypothetical protein
MDPSGDKSTPDFVDAKTSVARRVRSSPAVTRVGCDPIKKRAALEDRPLVSRHRTPPWNDAAHRLCGVADQGYATDAKLEPGHDAALI